MKRLIFTLLIISLLNNLYAQNTDSLAFEFGEKLSVFKNIRNQTFSIKKEDKTLFKNLKFVSDIRDYYLQILTKNNSIFYIDENGQKHKQTGKMIQWLCGTVYNYSCEIKDIGKKYVITKVESMYGYNENQTEIIGTIDKTDVKKIYFNNDSKKIEYDGNYNYTLSNNMGVFPDIQVFPDAVIIEKNNQKGILHNGILTFYDDILEHKYWIFKVKLNGKVGYYGITKIKYKTLEHFIFGLAKFKLPNGKTGYVDAKGKEY